MERKRHLRRDGGLGCGQPVDRDPITRKVLATSPGDRLTSSTTAVSATGNRVAVCFGLIPRSLDICIFETTGYRLTYLYRAVDARGQTVDFRLKRDVAAAKAFFCKAFKTHGSVPRTITLDG
jgi:hypothetical protein